MAGQTVPPVREDEVFELESLQLYMKNGSMDFTDEAGVTDIIESNNYFTILDRDGKHILCIKSDRVEHFEMVLKTRKEVKKRK